MCERTYTACGGCDARVEDSIRYVTTLYYTEQRSESVDEDGDPNGQSEDYGDPDYSDQSESRLVCMECGWEGQQSGLDRECEPDDCECEECQPPDIDNLATDERGEEIVSLRRREGVPAIPEREFEDWPPEITLLCTDRLRHFIPITRKRAEEIACLCRPELDIDVEANSYNREPFYIDIDTIVPEDVQDALHVEPPETPNVNQLTMPTEEATVVSQ